MSIIRDTLVIFPITYIVGGGSKPRAAVLVDRVPIQIDEIAPPQVAGSVGPHAQWHSGDDRLLFNWSRSYRMPPGSLDLALLDRQQTTNPLDPWSFVGDTSIELVDAAEAPSALNIREIVSSQRDAAVAELHRQARGLAVAGTELFIESLGPRLTLAPHKDVPAERGRVVQVHEATKGRKSKLTAPGFGIHDAKSARAILSAAGLSSAFRFVADLMINETTPLSHEIALAEAFPQSVGLESLLTAADLLLFSAMPNRAFSHLTMGHMEAYLRFTDPMFDRTDPEAVAEVLRLAVSDMDLGNYESMTGKKAKELIYQAKIAIQIFEFEKRRLDTSAEPASDFNWAQP